jgi:hypothetical protein
MLMPPCIHHSIGFVSIVAEDHHMIWDPIIIVPWISLKVMSFPTAVSFLFFDNDDCLYFIRQGEGVTSSTTILHLRSSRRFGIYDCQGILLF